MSSTIQDLVSLHADLCAKKVNNMSEEELDRRLRIFGVSRNRVRSRETLCDVLASYLFCKDVEVNFSLEELRQFTSYLMDRDLTSTPKSRLCLYLRGNIFPSATTSRIFKHLKKANEFNDEFLLALQETDFGNLTSAQKEYFENNIRLWKDSQEKLNQLRNLNFEAQSISLLDVLDLNNQNFYQFKKELKGYKPTRQTHSLRKKAQKVRFKSPDKTKTTYRRNVGTKPYQRQDWITIEDDDAPKRTQKRRKTIEDDEELEMIITNNDKVVKPMRRVRNRRKIIEDDEEPIQQSRRETLEIREEIVPLVRKTPPSRQEKAQAYDRLKEELKDLREEGNESIAAGVPEKFVNEDIVVRGLEKINRIWAEENKKDDKYRLFSKGDLNYLQQMVKEGAYEYEF